jgi:GDP-4-dehydro-6-deoxy-D-mannose reductase
MLKVLITGSNGFVGRHLQDFLSSNQSIKGAYEVQGFDLAMGNDIRIFEDIRNTVDRFQPDYVYHLAAQAYVPESTMNPIRGIETNFIGTLNLLEAVRQTGMQSRIHIAGTSEEYGYDRDDSELNENSVAIPTTPYGVSKLAATTLAMTYARIHGMNIVVTRAWNHIGPGASPSYAVSAFSKRVAEAEKYGVKVTHGNLEAIRNYTDVRDIVRGYTLAIDLPPGIYNLASANSVSIQYILDCLTGLAKTKIETEENSYLFRAMSNKFPKPSFKKFNELTGWESTIDLDQTILDTLNYWRNKV